VVSSRLDRQRESESHGNAKTGAVSEHLEALTFRGEGHGSYQEDDWEQQETEAHGEARQQEGRGHQDQDSNNAYHRALARLAVQPEVPRKSAQPGSTLPV